MSTEVKNIEYPKDIHGIEVKVGDKIRGFGSISFAPSGFKIDRTSIVTANMQNDTLYFGQLSAKSFDRFEIISETN